MSENIDNPTRQALAYWYADGLSELCMGVVLFLVGVVLLIEGPAPHDSLLAAAMLPIRYIVILGGTFCIGLALRYFKLNLTYPRRGYVIYRKPGFKELFPALMVILTLALLLHQWVRVGMPEKLTLFVWLIAGLTIFFAYLFVSWSAETGFQRFFVLAALTIAAGLAITALGVWQATQENTFYLLRGPGLFFASLGLASSLSGGLALRRFLLSTRRQAVEGRPA